MTINSELNQADFSRLSDSVRGGFLDKKATIVDLPPGTRLYKLSSYDTQNSQRSGCVSPWWSPVHPFKEDLVGAAGRFAEAKLNKVTMQAMVRFASAVRIDWNSLDDYHEVKLRKGAKCFWGRFNPQPSETNPLNLNSYGRGGADNLTASEKIAAVKAQDETNQAARAKISEYVPDTLGGIDAWQFYIPGLKTQHLDINRTIPANNMEALAVHFSLV